GGDAPDARRCAGPEDVGRKAAQRMAPSAAASPGATVRIPVLDNGGQWTHREWRVLRELGAESEIVPNTTPFEELRADGIVLSGGALSLEGTDTPLGAVAAWIDRADVP